MAEPRNNLFGRIVLSNKLVTEEQLNRAIQEIVSNPGMPLGSAMVYLGYLTESQVQKVLKLQREVLQRAAGVPEHAQTSAARPEPQRPPSPASPAGFTRIEEYLEFARQAGASDFHISVGSPPAMRVDGTLQYLPRESFTAQDTESLLRGFLSENKMQQLATQKSLEFALPVKGQRYRACLFKQRNGYDGVFRITPEEIPAISQLGLPDSTVRLTEYHQGMVLVTGPAGHGKSTTMAALLEHVNKTRSHHIITIEDPIEYVFQSKSCVVTQREVGSHTETFATALTGALREDPDVIMIGELRDPESVSIAITAAETGHLVFGTLHTASAARTIDRIIDALPPEQHDQLRITLSESLKGIISQYLVPRIDGKGRALACELLITNSAVSNLIRENRIFQLNSVMQTGKKQGMILMDDSLLDLVRRGIIHEEVAMPFVESPESFKRGLKKI